MGKKRAVAVSAPAIPFPAPTAGEPEPDHFSDYGFDPQLVHFFSHSQPEVKRLWGRRQRHHQQQPAQLKPLDSARFKLQKPISKKHRHLQKPQQQRRRWWSSAAAAALHLFKKRERASSSTRPAPAAAAPTPPYGFAASTTTVPLYLADYDAAGGDDDGGAAACTCWAPAVRSSSGSRLAAAELGAAAVSAPYVSLRSTSLAGGGTGGAPVMPIYLVT